MDNREGHILANVVLESIKEQRRSRRWKIFFRFIWLLIAIIILVAITTKDKSDFYTIDKGPEVAVVDLKGIISDDNDTYKNLALGLNNALKDKKTVAVIIRANSPGGSPVYSDMLYNEILRLRKKYPNKPIDVVASEVCASGCYYIAAAANHIYAAPASIVGSIGVIYTGFGLNQLMSKIGVDSRLLISGKNKAMGYPFVPANHEQSLMQQQMLDEVHSQFINAVVQGRGKKLKLTNKELFSGRYWLGQDAINLGLIDGFATVDTLAREHYHSENIVDFTENKDDFDKWAKRFSSDMVDAARNQVVASDLGQMH